MPDEREIQAVMINTDCDRETAIEALEWANSRVTIAIRRVVMNMNQKGLICPACLGPIAERWMFCPFCGEPLKRKAADDG